MSKKPTKDAVTTANARISIEEQTAAFLKSGGAIQYVAKGTSGHIGPAGSKQINLKNG